MVILPLNREVGVAAFLTAALLSALVLAVAASAMARLDASYQPASPATLLPRHLARDITFKVETSAARREAFLILQAIDVLFQCGIDLPRAEHATRYQFIANADL
jgi:hypothetical protein